MAEPQVPAFLFFETKGGDEVFNSLEELNKEFFL